MRSDTRGLRPFATHYSACLLAVRIDIFGPWHSNLKMRQQVVLQQHRSTRYNLESHIVGQVSSAMIHFFNT